MDPDSKLMMEQMGFAQFTAKWQNNKWEEEEMKVKEEKPTFRFSFLTECCSVIPLLHIEKIHLFPNIL